MFGLIWQLPWPLIIKNLSSFEENYKLIYFFLKKIYKLELDSRILFLNIFENIDNSTFRALYDPLIGFSSRKFRFGYLYYLSNRPENLILEREKKILIFNQSGHGSNYLSEFFSPSHIKLTNNNPNCGLEIGQATVGSRKIYNTA